MKMKTMLNGKVKQMTRTRRRVHSWGISPHKRRHKLQLHIRLFNGQTIHVGFFNDLSDAVIARNVELHNLYGPLGLLQGWTRQRIVVRSTGVESVDKPVDKPEPEDVNIDELVARLKELK